MRGVALEGSPWLYRVSSALMLPIEIKVSLYKSAKLKVHCTDFGSDERGQYHPKP